MLSAPPTALILEQTLRDAVAHHRAGRWSEAEQHYRAIVVVEPAHADSLHLLGVMASQAGGADLAIILIGRAIQLNDQAAIYHRNLGGAALESARWDKAEGHLRRSLLINPCYPEAWSILGDLQRRRGTLRGVDGAGATMACFRRALYVDPSYMLAFFNRAAAFHAMGRLAEAEVNYKMALALAPGSSEALLNYGVVLLELGQGSAAMVCATRSLVLVAERAEAFCAVANVLKERNALDQARNAYRKAMIVRPDLAEVMSNLGTAFLEQAMLDDAATCFRRAVALNPAVDEAVNNLIFFHLYRSDSGLAEIAALSRLWGERRVVPLRAPMPCRRTGGRPRIGFVSGDFRAHAVGHLVLPGITGLHETGYHITCYSTERKSDAVTARFQAVSSQWRMIAGWSDDVVVAQIQADSIDMLIDLSGRTGGNRLAVFARKPAPIQIAWAVGYPATTGLPTMDYLIADRWQVSPEAESFYSEKIVRLPDSYILFEGIADAPPIPALPALAPRRVTLGSFNVLKKITPEVIALWSRILRQLPDATLLIKNPALNCAGTARSVESRFAAHGINADRLRLVGRTSPEEHLRWMGEADIALDSFPYAGGMTTLECLWMGLPVVTLPGETFCSRHSFGYLSTIGLTELIATDAEHYADLVVDLARDPARLLVFRQGIRQRILASPLCDRDRFVRHFDGILRGIWNKEAGDGI